MIIPNIWKKIMFQTTNQICLTICGRIHLFGLVFFSQGPNPADLGQWPTWWSPGFEKKNVEPPSYKLCHNIELLKSIHCESKSIN